MPPSARYRFLLFDDKREVELVWNGKGGGVCSVALPFQVIEQVDEPRDEGASGGATPASVRVFPLGNHRHLGQPALGRLRRGRRHPRIRAFGQHDLPLLPRRPRGDLFQRVHWGEYNGRRWQDKILAGGYIRK